MIKLKKFKARLLLLTTAIAIAVISFYFVSPAFNQKSTAYAIGDLTVNWGVISEDSPIFVVNNMAPGQSQDRDVTVNNGAPSIRPVGVRGIQVSETGSLGSVLEITISVAGTDVYGGTTGTKTVSQFIAESAEPNGIFLTNLDPSQTKTINFKVDFPSDAGNEFQNASIVFDLKIGISIDLPAQCDLIDLLPSPIIGTTKAETLNGTPGNDLIMGLEGADHINGNGGNDCILGGSGADKINGNIGDDAIFGGDGADSINGNDGSDVVFGEGGADTIHGNNDNDFIVGGTGADSIYGENGQDQLFGNEDADSLRGGNDNDSLDGGPGSDSLKGENGNDSLIGGTGIDSANGGANIDTCTAESKTNCEL